MSRFKCISWLKWIILAGLLSSSVDGLAQTLAFDEAQGFGRFATGARGNLAAASVYHVTNLNDSGPGSFRDAVSQGNRFVVFDVGGIVTLNSAVSVDKSNLYIAGQTAPGGISFYNDKVSFSGANNLIARYMGIRLGTSQGREDASGLSRGSNMIFDHMSFTWGVDETFSMNPESGQTIDNITVQNSIIGQGLDVVGHSAGGLMTIGEGNRFSIIQSLFADNVTRNPKVRGENEFINNVVYGYESAGYIMGDTSATSNANVVGNYFIEGPVDGSSPFASGTSTFHLFAQDNWVDGNRNGILDGSLITSYPGADLVTSPHAFPTTASMSAQQAVEFVLNNVGPNITRDAVDSRILEELASLGTIGGVIVRDSDLFPGWNTNPQYLNPRARLTDSDNDGMPDNWEISRGLNPSNASDFSQLSGAYTQLEKYLNELGGYGTTRTFSGGTWGSAGSWNGAVPSFADSAFVPGGMLHETGHAFARQAVLNGTSVISGGTLDVFDTLRVGASQHGHLQIQSGIVSAGRVMLGGSEIGSMGALTLLTGSTLRTGTISSSGGTAQLTIDGGAVQFTGVPNVTVSTIVGTHGALLDTNGLTGSLSGSISGAGQITKSGGGTLIITGDNSFGGGIQVNGGALSLAHIRAAGTGSVRLNNAMYLPTISNITNAIEVQTSGTIMAGGITIGGDITGGPSATLSVITSSSGASNTSLGGELGGFSGTLDLSSSTGNIRINRSGSGAAHWNLGGNGVQVRTAFGGDVHLGSLNGGSTTRLAGATNSATLTNFTIGARNTNSTFSGLIMDGPFVGSTTGITKVGTGLLTLWNTANTYTGPTSIREGTLSLTNIGNGGVASTIGMSTNAATNLVLDGGTLRYMGGNATTDRLFTLGSNGGSIESSGSGTIGFTNTSAIAHSGSGSRVLTLGGINSGFNNFSMALGDAAAGQVGLTKSGVGTWRLFGTLSYSGDTNVTAGRLMLIDSHRLPSGVGKGNVNIAEGATLDMYGSHQTINGLNGGGTVTTTINTARTLTVGAGDANGSFWGTLTQGTGQTLNLAKVGKGVQVISGINNASGSTSVLAGTLVINSNTGSGLTIVSSGATLSGSGNISGGLEVYGQVNPGDGLGTLTVESFANFNDGSQLTMELGDSFQSDQLVVNGHLKIGQSVVLKIVNSGWIAQPGQYFDLFTSTSIIGKFSDIQISELPNGMLFDTSELYSTGRITITSEVPEPSSLSLVIVCLALLVRRNRD